MVFLNDYLDAIIYMMQPNIFIGKSLMYKKMWGSMVV